MQKSSPSIGSLCLAAVLAVLATSPLRAQSATPESDSAKPGNEVLLAAARAAGGEQLASIKTLGIDESGKLSYPQGDATLNVKWLVSYPDRSHGDVILGEQEILQVCDGTSAWLQFAQGARDTTPMISEFKRGSPCLEGAGDFISKCSPENLLGNSSAKRKLTERKRSACQ